MNRMEWSTRGGGLTEIVTEASWREIGKVLQTSYSGRGKDSPKSEPTFKLRRIKSMHKSNLTLLKINRRACLSAKNGDWGPTWSLI